jgi:anthranilate synthase/aminodeoxychorismate synthase-like glutamine amidotransferase
MILLLDNRDSFVFNLARYFQMLGAEARVVSSHSIDVSGIAAMSPAAIVISPGPCTPAEAGCSLAAVRAFRGRVPILGVCLGHQAIAAAAGGRIIRGREPVHGRTSPVHHDGCNLFAGIPFAPRVESGDIKIEGDAALYAALIDLIEPLTPNFPIVTP